MSRRWRIAGLVLAAIAFVAILAGPVPHRDDLLGSLPVVLQAGIAAVSVFVAVWLFEGIYHAALWVGRRVFPAQPQGDERR